MFIILMINKDNLQPEHIFSSMKVTVRGTGHIFILDLQLYEHPVHNLESVVEATDFKRCFSGFNFASILDPFLDT